MSITVHLPALLSTLAAGERRLTASGVTLGDAIADVARRFPQLKPRLTDDLGNPYPFVTYYLNQEDIRFTGGFGAAVRDGDEVTIVPALAGG